MMKKRVLSAIVMLLICVPLIIIGGIPFRVGVGVLAILAYKEVLELKGLNKYPKDVALIGLGVLLALVYSNKDMLFSSFGLGYEYIALVILLMLLPSIVHFEKGTYTTKDALKLMSFVLFLGIVLNLLSNILIYQREYFILILLVTILTDTFAYVIGKMIGRHTFTSISPNKTIEGCIGGVVMGSVLTYIYYMTFIGISKIYIVIPALVVMSIICEAGDLFYSAIKREENIKDFSNLIPGHGGVLDRIDSLTFVTLAFVLLERFL